MELNPEYKMTETGLIPKDWEIFSLDELGTFKNGINKIGDDFGHGHPFVNLMDVFGVSRITSSDQLGLLETNAVERQMYDLRTGDVIFVRSSVKPSGVGLTAVVEHDLPATVYSGFLIRFRDYGRIANGFKRYCFSETRFRNSVIAASSVSANTNINQNNLKRLFIPLPPTTAEQETIAEALGDADVLIESLEQLLTKKRQLKQGTMQELLTGKKRLPGFTGQWTFYQLGHLGWFLKGYGVKKDEAQSGDLACVRYGEIYTHHDEYIKVFNSWISPEVAANATQIEYGDILFAGSGETKEEIGKCVAFVDEIEAYAGGDVIVFRADGHDPFFLGYYLNSIPISRQKASKGQGDAVVHISATSLADVEVQLPKLSEQFAIASILTDMDAEIDAIETKLIKARQIKQGMMQELLTGRIRLV